MQSSINLTKMPTSKEKLEKNINDYDIDENAPFKWKKHLVLPMFRITNN